MYDRITHNAASKTLSIRCFDRSMFFGDETFNPIFDLLESLPSQKDRGGLRISALPESLTAINLSLKKDANQIVRGLLNRRVSHIPEDLAASVSVSKMICSNGFIDSLTIDFSYNPVICSFKILDCIKEAERAAAAYLENTMANIHLESFEGRLPILEQLTKPEVYGLRKDASGSLVITTQSFKVEFSKPELILPYLPFNTEEVYFDRIQIMNNSVLFDLIKLSSIRD
ncbi:hypothetical protein ACI2KR_30140 [Pseudomonas luteola]